jgi:signal peptidase I
MPTTSTGKILNCGFAAEKSAAAGCALIPEVLRLSGTVRLRAFGSSMLPAIFPGDILIIDRAELNRSVPGDIVLFKRDKRLFAHRVVGQHDRNGVRCLVTSGDALAECDSPVFPEELLGRVNSIVRGTRQIDPNATLLGRLISISLRNSDLLRRCFLWLLCRTRCFREGSECPT